MASNYHGDIHDARWLISISFFLITVNRLSRGPPADESLRDRPGNATDPSKLIRNGKLLSLLIKIYSFAFPQYEYKIQNAKKKKVTIEISVDGVRICLKKRKRKALTVSFSLDAVAMFRIIIFIFITVFVFRKNLKTGRETWARSSWCNIQSTESFMCPMTAAIWRSSATSLAMAAPTDLNAWCSRAIKRWDTKA